MKNVSEWSFQPVFKSFILVVIGSDIEASFLSFFSYDETKILSINRERANEYENEIISKIFLRHVTRRRSL